jgi:PAS domain S-box-containing protein
MIKLSLTQRYIPAVLLLVIFVIFSHILIHNVVNANNELAKIINISGKQRMLSQRLIILGQDYYEDSLKIKPFKAALNEIKTAHKYLITKNITKRLDEIYFKEGLDKNLKKYLKHFDNLLVLSNPMFLKTAREDSKAILVQLDGAVKEYERYSNERIKIASKYEFYLMLGTLFILLLEVIFIFRPAAKQIEDKTKKLIETKDYEETVIESNNNAIIAIDYKGKITTYNQKAVEIFGWTKQEMINTTNLSNIIPNKYKQLHNEASSKYFKTGKSCGVLGKNHELEAIRKDGTIFPIRISFGSRFKMDGTIVVANISDITEEKKQNSIMIEQSKMASMGEMIGNIAHQWRQPLSAISTSASAIQVEKECGILSDDGLDTRLSGIIDKTNFLSNTINDFRDFFKQSEDKELFKVNEILSQVENLTSATYKSEDVIIYKNYDTSLDVYCLGFANQLSQVLINIFNNAKDILVEKECIEKKVKIDLYCLDDKITIKIYDSAGGVPLDIIQKIFDSHFTTKQNSHGTGIGLYMSKEIINNHFNGKISVSNENFHINDKEYYGACFSITIPSDVNSEDI